MQSGLFTSAKTLRFKCGHVITERKDRNVQRLSVYSQVLRRNLIHSPVSRYTEINADNLDNFSEPILRNFQYCTLDLRKYQICRMDKNKIDDYSINY